MIKYILIAGVLIISFIVHRKNMYEYPLTNGEKNLVVIYSMLTLCGVIYLIFQ